MNKLVATVDAEAHIAEAVVAMREITSGGQL